MGGLTDIVQIFFLRFRFFFKIVQMRLLESDRSFNGIQAKIINLRVKRHWSLNQSVRAIRHFVLNIKAHVQGKQNDEGKYRCRK